jgi:hypothetical protein
VDYFSKQFAKFEVNLNAFTLTWNWAAFFFGPFYLFFRKAYLEGIVSVIIVSVLAYVLQPFALFVTIGFALIANFIIYGKFFRESAMAASAYPTNQDQQITSCYAGRRE